jgi:hypothetical protein
MAENPWPLNGPPLHKHQPDNMGIFLFNEEGKHYTDISRHMTDKYIKKTPTNTHMCY